jgi:hypothetical protein
LQGGKRLRCRGDQQGEEEIASPLQEQEQQGEEEITLSFQEQQGEELTCPLQEQQEEEMAPLLQGEYQQEEELTPPSTADSVGGWGEGVGGSTPDEPPTDPVLGALPTPDTRPVTTVSQDDDTSD